MTVGPSIPGGWVGWWVAADGKAVLIEHDGGGFAVTVSPAKGARPYKSARLLSLRRKRIRRLPARCSLNRDGERHLEIEAGTNSFGPTYALYPCTANGNGTLRPAEDDAEVEDIILIPEIGIGLYDDWDEDLGVPWAEPLEPLTWVERP